MDVGIIFDVVIHWKKAFDEDVSLIVGSFYQRTNQFMTTIDAISDNDGVALIQVGMMRRYQRRIRQ
nr:MAG: hypothetical protein CM15mP61_12330 [Gammaproteobacteria bacterium]